MTREEEREQAAENAHLDIYEKAIDIFIKGAQWADKTMLDKICNWLKEHIGTYNDTIDSIHGTIKIFNKEKFIEDLRKAMEE